MKLNEFKIKVLIILIPVFFYAVTVSADGNPAVNVFVSILPQSFFVERIGEGRVSVDVLVLPGKSPGTYVPTPSQMVRLARSDIFFSIGVPFEKSFLPKIENASENLEIVDTSAGITLREMSQRHAHHDEEKMEKHDETGHDSHNNERHEGMDPHIWMSPVLAKQVALNMYNALVKTDPEGKDVYEANYQKLITDLDVLDREIRRLLAPVKGENLFVFHPAYGYFADEYGLHQIAVETEGKSPRGKELAAFIKKAKEKGVRVVFVQPEFDSSAAQIIAEAINGAVVPLDPLAKDYIANLENMAVKVAGALKR